MHPELEIHWDHLLETYTTGKNRENLLIAKSKYFETTGTVYEDDDEYESRMNCFNDWYLSQYIPQETATTIVKDYVSKNAVDSEVVDSLLNINYSLFLYNKKTYKNEIVLKDLVHKKKLTINDELDIVGMISGDLFSGRVLNYQGQNYLLNGVCLYPREVRTILEKEAKNVGKLKEPLEESSFVLKCESLKVKWIRYGHIDAAKIFDFT